MEVTGDSNLIYDSGEAAEAVAVLKAAGIDPEHFVFHVKRTPSSTISYAVSVTNRVTQRGATLAGGPGANWVQDLKAKITTGELQ
jgi:hypothetical protein